MSIVDVFGESEVKIGKIIPEHNSYDKNYYIMRTIKKDNQEVSEEEFIKNISEKVTLISYKAGMGKSCLLTSLSLLMKRNEPHLFIFRIDLNDLTKPFQKFQDQKDDLENRLEEYIKDDLLSIKSSTEKVLFEKYRKSGKGLVIFLDGYDEVSPFYDDMAISFTRTFIKLNFEKILLTTRPEKREDLEKEFKTSRFSIKPFPRNDQINFLMKQWNKRSCDDKMKQLATRILEILNTKIKDKDFISIPLATKLIANHFNQYFAREGCDNNVLQFASQLSVNELFERYIESKYEIYFEEKKKIDDSKNFDLIKVYREKLDKYFLRIAISEVFPEEIVAEFPESEKFQKEIKIKSDILKCGLLYQKDNGTRLVLKFDHKTFAEHYVAKYFLNKICVKNASTNISANDLTKLVKIFVTVVLVEPRYQVLRSFIDGKVLKFECDEAIKIEINNYILEDRRSSTKYFGIAINENNMNNFKFLCQSILITDKNGEKGGDQQLVRSLENLYNFFEEAEGLKTPARSLIPHLDFIMLIYLKKSNDNFEFVKWLQNLYPVNAIPLFSECKDILFSAVLSNRYPKNIKAVIEFLEVFSISSEKIKNKLLDLAPRVWETIVSNDFDPDEIENKIIFLFDWLHNKKNFTLKELQQIITKICNKIRKNFKFYLKVLGHTHRKFCFDLTFFVEIFKDYGIVGGNNWLVNGDDTLEVMEKNVFYFLDFLKNELRLDSVQISEILCECEEVSHKNILHFIIEKHPKFEFLKFLTIIRTEYKIKLSNLTELLFARYEDRNFFHFYIDSCCSPYTIFSTQNDFLGLLLDLNEFYPTESKVMSDFFSQNSNLLIYWIEKCDIDSVNYIYGIFQFFQYIFKFQEDHFIALFLLRNSDIFFRSLTKNLQVHQMEAIISGIANENILSKPNLIKLLTYSENNRHNIMQTIFSDQKNFMEIFLKLRNELDFDNEMISEVFYAKGFDGMNVFHFAVFMSDNYDEVLDRIKDIVSFLKVIHSSDIQKIYECFLIKDSKNLSLINRAFLSSVSSYLDYYKLFTSILTLTDGEFSFNKESVERVLLEKSEDDMTLLQYICKISLELDIFQLFKNVLYFLKTNFDINIEILFRDYSKEGMNLLHCIISKFSFDHVADLNDFINCLKSYTNSSFIEKQLSLKMDENSLNPIQCLFCKIFKGPADLEETFSSFNFLKVDITREYLLVDENDACVIFSEIFKSYIISSTLTLDSFIDALKKLKDFFYSDFKNIIVSKCFLKRNILQFVCAVSTEDMAKSSIFEVMDFLGNLKISSLVVNELFHAPDENNDDKIPLDYLFSNINCIDDLGDMISTFYKEFGTPPETMKSIIFSKYSKINLFYHAIKCTKKKESLFFKASIVTKDLIDWFKFGLEDIKKIFLTEYETDPCLLLWLTSYVREGKVFGDFLDFWTILTTSFKNESLKEFLTFKKSMQMNIFQIIMQQHSDESNLLLYLKSLRKAFKDDKSLLAELIIPINTSSKSRQRFVNFKLTTSLDLGLIFA